MRRIYVERTGRMPPEDFRTSKASGAAKRRPYTLMVVVPLLCGTGGLVAANALGGNLGSALRLATGSGISVESALTLIEICSDKLGGLGTREAHIALEHAAQSVRDMPSADAPSPF